MLAVAALAVSSAVSPVYQQLRGASVISATDGQAVSPLQGVSSTRKSLVVLLPQLGEFDSAEFCEQLVALDGEMEAANIDLRVCGIGDAKAAARFSSFIGLDPSKLTVDPAAALHESLGLHAGPGWVTPDFVPDGLIELLLSTLPGGKPEDPAKLRPVFDAWLNYLAMCARAPTAIAHHHAHGGPAVLPLVPPRVTADGRRGGRCAGIAAPGTLPEIARGYFGDRAAPERLAPDAVVTAGPVVIGPGVGPVKLGPLAYTNGWADEAGYQRPVELATVRLRHMVEVLTNWDTYVADATHIARRGATYLFDEDGSLLYEYRHRGVLTYSATMARPLTFLAPHVGANALNPLGLGDRGLARAAGAAPRGEVEVLK